MSPNQDQALTGHRLQTLEDRVFKDLEPRMRQLEDFKAKLLGAVAGLSLLGGFVGAVAGKWLTR